jgi:CHASE2 domain-containing sensor protein
MTGQGDTKSTGDNAVRRMPYLRHKNVGHWVRVVLVIVLGLYASHLASEHTSWIDLYLYQRLSELDWRPLEPRNTVIVLIDDELFWRGRLAGRNPVKRDYLAELITVLDCAGADVIALDVDLRSPDPNGQPPDHPDYASETTMLVNTIKRSTGDPHPCITGNSSYSVPSRRIVLSRALGASRDGHYVAQANIYDGAGLCHDDANTAAAVTVYCGYLELSHDIRILPPALLLDDGHRMVSFALAIIQARRRLRPDEGLDVQDRLRFGSYIPTETWYGKRKGRPASVVFLAREVLEQSPEARRQKLESKIVLVGGAWAELAYRRGQPVDLWPSPVGPIPGVLIHANYVEALLDSRTHAPIPELTERAIELGLLLLCLVAFKVRLRAWHKSVVVGALLFSLLLTAYFAFQNLGLVFDVFIPLLFLGAHAGFEQVLEWRAKARLADVR